MTNEIKNLLLTGTKKVFLADDGALQDALSFTESFLESAGCSMKITMSMTVSVEEIFVNVAHYAYPEGEVGEVTLTMAFGDTSGEKTLVFRFEDAGAVFNPLEEADPDISLSSSERQIGGLGIFMVKKMTDGIFYEHHDGKNVLTFYKYI